MLASGFLISFRWAQLSFEGEKFVSVARLNVDGQRNIAVAKRDFQLNTFSNLSLSPIRSLINAQVINTESFSQIKLGNFSVKNPRGEPVYACQVYDKITVTYEAFVDEKTGNPLAPQTLSLELPCKIAEGDVRHLETITLSPKEILKETPSDGTFPFNENVAFSVKLQNVDGKWATRWNIKSIQFADSQAKSLPVDLSATEISQSKRKELEMRWNKFE